jgi:hypothetical protein
MTGEVNDPVIVPEVTTGSIMVVTVAHRHPIQPTWDDTSPAHKPSALREIHSVKAKENIPPTLWVTSETLSTGAKRAATATAVAVAAEITAAAAPVIATIEVTPTASKTQGLEGTPTFVACLPTHRETKRTTCAKSCTLQTLD